MSFRIYHALGFSALCILLGACGGGGGGGSDNNAGGNNGNVSDDSVTPPATDLNPGMSGRLYFSSPENHLELDLASGLITAMRPKDGNARAAPDADEFVTLEDPLSGESGRHDIVVYGRDGRTLSRFEVEGTLLGAAKLSPDGQRIAVVWWPETGEAGESLAIFSRDGSEAQLFEIPGGLGSPKVESWDWTPAGELVFTIGDGLYRIAPQTDPTPQLIKSFPNDQPGSVSVSPDGNRIAFTLGDPDTLDNHVFVMNLDGSGLRQLTTSGINETSPAWSPDGSQIAVRYGVNSAGAAPSGHCPSVFLIPSDAENVQIDPDNPAPAHYLQMLENGEPRHVCAFSDLDWRPDPAAAPSSPGTAPSGDGLNAGLGGRLFFENPEFNYLNIDSGTAHQIPTTHKGNGLFPSIDGQEVAYSQSRADSGNRSNEQITIQTLDGSVTASFELPPSFSGPPKLSSDGQRIAVGWSSLDLGDPAGIRIVTVFDRQGNAISRLGDFDHWDWLPDDRLLLARRNELHITDNTQQNPQLIITLSDRIDSLDASPDGSRIAIGMVGHAWVLNQDGSNLRQVTQSSQGESDPAWSPDNSYLAVKLDRTCPEVHVVPADGERVFIDHPTDNHSSLQLRQLENDKARNVCAFSELGWRN